MHEPLSPSEALPVGKARHAAAEAAQSRLRRAAEHMQAHCTAPDGVIFSKRWCRPGQPTMNVLFAWPGVLMLQEPRTGRVVKEARASYMEQSMPHETAFLRGDRKAASLLALRFVPPQSAPCRLVFDAWGVLTIFNFKTGEVLAKSQSGRPALLQTDFCPLNRRDLEPRIQ
ncbi:hypothetical protein N0K08_05840 [Acidovorax sp. Be4]|uniref:Uncharacterized protein n=1 Tax=Acidovorax bellezanensis TaxID=2976702 RepID=A0ABT2PI37_9BURK|nr:hypothetical protein [Acidovorax sp. Be4]MCT9810144.1 hypothetical protein [Acidovorax sp. Be4]